MQDVVLTEGLAFVHQGEEELDTHREVVGLLLACSLEVIVALREVSPSSGNSDKMA